MITYRSITLVPVDGWRNTIVFTSSIEKENYIRTHGVGEYTFCMNGNAVHENLFVPIDRNVCGGFVLSRSGLTYSECVILVDMYL